MSEPKNYSHVCPECFTTFVSKRKDAITCGVKCRVARKRATDRLKTYKTRHHRI